MVVNPPLGHAAAGPAQAAALKAPAARLAYIQLRIAFSLMWTCAVAVNARSDLKFPKNCEATDGTNKQPHIQSLTFCSAAQA